ncbi:MAG: hypothetical protein DRJ30_04800, partial [Candidatus Methanomethylicota archaeon]
MLQVSSPHYANGEDACRIILNAISIDGDRLPSLKIAIIVLKVNVRDFIVIVHSGFATDVGNGTYIDEFKTVNAGEYEIGCIIPKFMTNWIWIIGFLKWQFFPSTLLET